MATNKALQFLSMFVLATGCASSDPGPLGSVDHGTGGSADGGASGDLAVTPTTPQALVGVWDVAGTDERGAYTGQLELRAGAEPTFARVIHYTTYTVEDSRELWWAWTGTASATTTGYAPAVSLARADFVRSRGGVTRTDADKTPMALTGTIGGGPGGTIVASFPDLSITDTLTNRTDSTTTPIFATSRTVSPVTGAPSSATKASLFALYASYQALPTVAPYVNDPQFQAGVLDVVTDTTDFDFYRAHPGALRVVNKIIDAPSLGETLVRANAFGQTLAQKAAIFDAETPTKFIDPVSGQLVDSVVGGVQQPTGDGALWTSAWIASQAFRWLLTKDPAALANVTKSADGIQVLMEITPDQTTFARTLRKATGAATGIWHAGTGAYAAYDWMEGGNNDMFKGLIYGTLTAYMVLCDPVVPGASALCSRMRTNAHHMLSLGIVGGATDNNHLMAAWLSAYTNGSIGDAATAIESWTVLAPTIVEANLTTTAYGAADWSGTHLNFVQFATFYLLSKRAALPGVDTLTTVGKGVANMRDQFQTYRMGLWSVLFATLSPNIEQPDVDNARWRLRELVAPKLALDVDHRVSPDFVMSPYPTVPWKMDWTTTDRSQGLFGYPSFEMPLDVYTWRSSPFDYVRNTEGSEHPGADYSHAYWLGRYLGLIDPTE